MNAEQQRKYRIQTARRRRRQRRRACCVCMLTVMAGLVITFAIWHDWANGLILAGWGSGQREEPASGQADGRSIEQNNWQTGQEYPESLLELLELNPEAEQFVRDYFQNKDKHPKIDLSEEVTQGTIPLFLQWDERWGYETYGSDMIAITGCGPTCLSMVWCGLSGDTKWDPLTMARYAEREGYYVKGAGTAWDLMTAGAADLGLTVREIVFDGDHILTWLAGGNPIICAMRPGDFTTTGHFIVLSSVDEYGKVKVCDPNSIINSEKTWDVEELIPQIKNLWAYEF